MTDRGSGLGSTPSVPDTYTYFVTPDGEKNNFNEPWFTVTALGATASAVRADAIAIPHDATCLVS
jgi:hypothetical protein